MTFNTDMFTFSHRGNEYVYAPCRRLLLRVTPSMRLRIDNIANACCDDLEAKISETDLAILHSLKLIGQPPDNASTFSEVSPFLPTEVTLFLTNQCNLCCTYCYASAGEKNQLTMSPEIGEAAIDVIIENARKTDSAEVRLGFHGGGEPTLNWNTLTHLALYCRNKAKQQGVSANISLATNGIFDAAKARWITKHLDGANVSLDGRENVHDHQRPLHNGDGSFKTVDATLKMFTTEAFPHGIRCTVTKDNVAQIEELAAYVHGEYSCSHMHFEPVSLCGRCKTGPVKEPTPEDFIEHFRLAENVLRNSQTKAVFSAVRPLTVTSHFCTGEIGAFCVTPDGYVSSCYEVTDNESELAKIFMIGHFDPALKSFSLNHESIQNLRNFGLKKPDLCSDCFCKYHCAGYCLAKRQARIVNNQKDTPKWCRIIRELTKDALLELETNCIPAE